MRIAIPTLNEEFSPHFGLCDGMLLCEFNAQTCRVESKRHFPRKGHCVESLADWLVEMAVEMVLAGGMGNNSMQHLESRGIDCCVGMTGQVPYDIIRQFINEPDKARQNICPLTHHETAVCAHEC